MTLNQHVKITAIASIPLIPFWSATQLILFAVGSILIDVDHYFLYIAHKMQFDISGMFRFFHEIDTAEPPIPYAGICIFHTVDFFFLLSLVSIIYPSLLFLLIGAIFHFSLDLYDLRQKNSLHIRAYFIIEHFIRKRRYGVEYPFI